MRFPPSPFLSLHRPLKLPFSLLNLAAAFLSLLNSLFSTLLSAFSASMDDLFADGGGDFFSASNDAFDDGDLLFPRRNRRNNAEFSGAEDRLYLVPYRWWEDAVKECYRDSDEIRGELYESPSPSLEDDSDSTVVGGSDLDWEVSFSLARREIDDDSEGREDHSSCKYALLPETMWFKALKWHCDYGTANKDLGCSLAAEGDSWDLYPVQIRLSVVWQTGSIVVKICQTDNMFQNYRRAYELFGPQSSMIRMWDFSGQITKLLKVDSTVPHHDVFRANVEVQLELHIYRLLSPESHKMNGYFKSEKNSSSLTESRDRGHGEFHLLGLTGLLNLGNTCFMNSAIQCLVHTPKLVDFFLADYKKEINYNNPLGLNGQLALAFGDLLRMLWRPGETAIAPRAFKSTLACFAPQFSGYNQHDSQEFLSFLLDGLHEDLNRVKDKPYKEVSDIDGRPDDEVADEYWQNHLARNDSVVVDLFQGQYRSTLTCPMCKHVSVTFDPFMYLSLPLPSTTMRTMTVTVVSNDGITLPSELIVTVPHYGRCKDLIQALSKACCLGEDEHLLLAEVYNRRILQFLDDLSGSLALIRDSDCLVAYRLPTEIESGQVVVFMHQQEERSYLYGRLKTDAKMFGIPLVTILPNILSESLVRKEFLKLIHPFRLHVDDISDEVDTGNDGDDINDDVDTGNDGDDINDDIDTGNDGDDINDDIDTGNSDNEDTKMEEARPVSNDDSSSEEEKVRSQLGNDFRFYQADDCGICGGLETELQKPFFISGAVQSLNLLVSWPNQMMRKYDTHRLSLLPEVFQHGVSAKSPHESVSVVKCLEAFLKEEPLGPEDMWYCPNCKKHRQANKKLDLWRLPEVLVIHLKRFSYSRFLKTKLETYVHFPINKLDLAGFIGHKNIPVSNCYRLYAISNHYGGMGGGHYTALAFHGNRWYEFDDSTVSPVSEDSVRTSAAYVLFYQRVSDT